MSEEAAPQGVRPAPATEEMLVRYLYSRPGFVRPIALALDWEYRWRGRRPWTSQDVRAWPRYVHQMVVEGVATREGNGYRITDPETMNRALARYVADQEQALAASEQARLMPAARPPLPPGVPSDIFDDVVGYDSVKAELLLALGATLPVSCLLLGPPASAKSLFMDCLLDHIPGAVLRYANDVTTAGLRQLVLDQRPRLLLLDELDKCPPDHDPVLLAILDQKISVQNFRDSRLERIDTRIIGAANSKAKMRRELVSRFHEINLPEYTPADFRRVAYTYLIRHGVRQDIADYVSEGMSGKTQDVRVALRIASMAHTLGDAAGLVAAYGTERRL